MNYFSKVLLSINYQPDILGSHRKNHSWAIVFIRLAAEHKPVSEPASRIPPCFLPWLPLRMGLYAEKNPLFPLQVAFGTGICHHNKTQTRINKKKKKIHKL